MVQIRYLDRKFVYICLFFIYTVLGYGFGVVSRWQNLGVFRLFDLFWTLFGVFRVRKVRFFVLIVFVLVVVGEGQDRGFRKRDLSIGLLVDWVICFIFLSFRFYFWEVEIIVRILQEIEDRNMFFRFIQEWRFSLTF